MKKGRTLPRVLVVLCFVAALIAGPLTCPVPAAAAAPDAPVNLSPADGEAGVSLTPTLQASVFTDADGDSHADSRWRIGEHEETVSGDLTTFAVPSGWLEYSTSYSWQVSYGDNTSEWSAWSAQSSFTTVAPPSEPPQVTTGDASSVGTGTATLNGDLASLGTASSVAVSFEWGQSTDYGNEISAGTLTAAGGFNSSLSGLSPLTTYHFRARAVGDGTDSGGDRFFTTAEMPVVPPEVTTGAATAVDTSSATLNGELLGIGTAESVSAFFEWGPDATYGQQTAPQAMSGAGAFSAGLGSLSPGSTYHFRAVAAGDGTAGGDDRTFTTAEMADEPPAVTTVEASAIDTTSATLNLTLTSLGTAASVQVSLEWGPTGTYGYATTAQVMNDAGSMSYTISGLAPETAYHFRARAAGDGTAYGADRTFTTAALPDEPPQVRSTAASSAGASSATLNLSLTSLGSAASVQVSFEWGLTTAYGSATAAKAMSRTGTSSSALSGLQPGSTYHFRAVAAGDGTAYGSDLTFTTVADQPAPPAVTTADASAIGTTSATLNLRLTDLGSAAAVQVSFEWGMSAEYGNSTEAQSMEGNGDFSLLISGLAAATAYHFRALAVGDGTAYGADMTFTTGTTPAVPPRVRTDDAGGIAAGSARLSGELVLPGTAASVTVCFVWGTSPGGPYPNETTGIARTESGAFYFDLDGLEMNTAYYYQARAVGDGVGYGVERSFTTTGQTPHIESLMAYSGRQGQALTVKITGSNLGRTTRVDFGDGIEVTGFTVLSDREIRASIVVKSGAESTARKVTVTTPSGAATYAVPGGFLTGMPVDRAPDDGPTVHLWVYLASAGGLAVVGVVAGGLGLGLRRRASRRNDG